MFYVFVSSVGQLNLKHIWFGLLFPPVLLSSELERPGGKTATCGIHAESESPT